MHLAVEHHGQRVFILELAVEDLSQQVIDMEDTLYGSNAHLKAKVIDFQG